MEGPKWWDANQQPKVKTIELEKDLDKDCDKNLEQTVSVDDTIFQSTKNLRSVKIYDGFFYGILAAFCFSATGFVSKILAKRKYHTINITLWKFQGMVLFGPMVFIYFTHQKKKDLLHFIWPFNAQSLKNILFLSIRGSLSVCIMICFTNSLQYLTLADAATITYSTPIAVVILGKIFLKEQFSIFSIILAMLTLFGVCVLARPPLLTGEGKFDTNHLIGVGFAFSAMLFLSSAYILVRYIRELHFSLSMIFGGIAATIECTLLGLFLQVLDLPRSATDWLLVVINALLTFGGQVAITLALQAEVTGLISLVRTIDVVFAFVWQLLLGVYPDTLSLLGAAIVVTTISISGFTKWLGSLPAGDLRRLRLWFLLK